VEALGGVAAATEALRGLSIGPLGVGGSALSDEEKAQIVAAARSESGVGEGSRFFEDPYELKTGRPELAARGLTDRMQTDTTLFASLAKGADGFEDEAREFAEKNPACGAEVVETVDYVLNQKTSEKRYPNGIRDQGRNGTRPAHFTSHKNAQDAGLSDAHVFSLRTYSTLVYKYMNAPLRDDNRYDKREKVPLPSLTYYADEGIRKSRAVRARASGDQRNVVLWRGMRSVKVSEEFMRLGGTELAFMSTTSELKVAVRYSLSRHSLLFKLVCPNFMSIGAELHWLSAFPGEAEVLFPPLTYLQPTGRTDRVDAVDRDGNPVTFTVVEVIPSF